MFQTNKLKQRVKNDIPSLGVWLSLANPALAEISGHVGYDFAIIDNEHGIGNIKDVTNMIRAFGAFETTPMVRVPGQDRDYLKRVLDAGAQALMIPMIETADHARSSVAACRYPPLGSRGCAAGLIRASDYGTADNYITTAHDELFIALQIESIKGVENTAKIAAVEGVDMIFIGANDLSGNCGMLSEYSRPEVVSPIKEYMAATKATLKYLGTIPRPDADYIQ
jgi:4-hydroxy-2-oxoheptanedioate aldolase